MYGEVQHYDIVIEKCKYNLYIYYVIIRLLSKYLVEESTTDHAPFFEGVTMNIRKEMSEKMKKSGR